MGTPEDVAAEEYLTPPTLTEMLRRNLLMEPECDADTQAMEDTLGTIKSTFKEWLKYVGIPYQHQTTVESTRQLIITLVDEP